MRKHFYLSIMSFLISSLTIWFMPLADFTQSDTNKAPAITLALVFWLGFVFGFVFLIPIRKRRKSDITFYCKKRPSLLKFFSTAPAVVFDCLLIFSFFAFVMSIIIPALPARITLALLFTLVFSLEMHGLFNGKNYMYLVVTR